MLKDENHSLHDEAVGHRNEQHDKIIRNLQLNGHVDPAPPVLYMIATVLHIYLPVLSLAEYFTRLQFNGDRLNSLQRLKNYTDAIYSNILVVQKMCFISTRRYNYLDERRV